MLVLTNSQSLQVSYQSRGVLTKLFESLVTSDTFEEFLTTQAYDLIE